MSNLGEEDKSKDASKSASSTSASDTSEEEMDTDAGVVVRSRIAPDPELKASDFKISSQSSSSSILQRDGDWTKHLAGLSSLLNTEGTGNANTGIRDGAGQPEEGPAAVKSTGTTEQTSKGPVNTDNLSASDKAHAYLKKRRDDHIRELKSSLGPTLLTYEAVNLANKRRLSAPYLQSGEADVEDHLEAEGDFFTIGDGRVRVMYMDCNLPLKRNLAYSFNP